MTARLISNLEKVLRVHTRERLPLLWLTLYATAAIGGVLTIGLSVSTSLFLSQLPASATAVIFVVSGIFLATTVLMYNRFSARVHFARLVIASSIILAMLALVFRVVLITSLRDDLWLLLSLELFIEGSFTLIIMQFWSYAAQVFDPRQARRLFGLLTIGGTAAIMVSGIVLAALVSRIGVENLLFVVSASMLLCALCASELRRWLPDAAHLRLRAGERSLLSGIKTIVSTPLLRSVAVLTVIVSLLINVAGYQFFLILQSAFAGAENAMAAFLGRYEFAAGLLALLLHLSISRRLIRDRGIFVAMLVFPVAVALGSGLVLATGASLLAVTLIRATDPVLRRTIVDPSLNALYLPLPAAQRSRAKELMEILYSLSFSVAGVVFMLVQPLPGWRLTYWSYPLLGLAIGWWLLSPRVRRHYLLALAESLRYRRLDPGVGALVLNDEESVGVLMRSLDDPDPLRVVHALNLISATSDGGWAERVRPLLKHPAPHVRVEALALVRRHGGWIDEDVALLDDPDEGVRAAGVAAVCEALGPAAIPVVAPLLAEASLVVRASGVLGLLEHGGEEGNALATPHLEAMLASPDARTRLEAATILGRLDTEMSSKGMAQLLADPVATVRRAAVGAAAHTPDRSFLPLLLANLDHAVTAPEARAALIALGPDILPDLLDSFAAGDLSSMARVKMVEVIATLGGERAEHLLLDRLEDRDPTVRTALYRALAQRAAHDAGRAPQLHARFADEVRELYRWALLSEDLKQASPGDLLIDAVARRSRAGLLRLLWLLAALHPGSGLMPVLRAADQDAPLDDPRLVEMLDTLVEPKLRALLLPLVEGSSEQIARVAVEQFGLSRRSGEQILADLTTEEDDWLGACALFEMGAHGHGTLDTRVTAALGAQSPLLRETALACVRRLHDSVLLARTARDCLADPDALVRAFAGNLLRQLEAAR